MAQKRLTAANNQLDDRNQKVENLRPILIRKIIMFWIIAPIVLTIFLVAFIEITGRYAGGEFFANAGGILLVAGIVPIISAHLTFASAVSGVVGLFFGLPSDGKFIVSLLVGLAFGAFFLHGIYLN